MPSKYDRVKGVPQPNSPEAKEYKAWILANHKALEKQYGIPEGSLLTVSAHESGFDPYAISHGNAKGAFQFTRATAQFYGLNLDGEIDDRLDYVKSAHAAAKYLKDNMKRYGSFKSAIADWNGGPLASAWVKEGKNPYDYIEKRSGNQELGKFLKGVEVQANNLGYGSLFDGSTPFGPTEEQKKTGSAPVIEKKTLTGNAMSVSEFIQEQGIKASPLAKINPTPTGFSNQNQRRQVLSQYAQKTYPIKVELHGQKPASSPQDKPQESQAIVEKTAIEEGKSVLDLRPDLFRIYKSGGSIIQLSGDGKTVEAVMRGKERIFSRPDTKRLIELAKKAKTSDDLFLLGEFLYDATKKQDSKPAEYVDA